ncbi:MAG: aminotransferase class V-fold PLP-dependent enzyme [archaeon GB-1867-005]|nr:aminotransferase class V-fold PLP-dependent enzyme [Candidatus Culexmicrobium cathedralense]
MNFEMYREEFPIVNEYIYLNHAAHSPASKRVVEAIKECLETLKSKGEYSINARETKRAFAKLINASNDEIALITNTSQGLNIIANMLNFAPGTNVVINDMEYPSNTYPWIKLKTKGVEVRFVKNENGIIPLEAYEKAIDDKTVAVAVSHVKWINGFKHNLKELAEIAHNHGAYLVVDAVQSAGAMKIDVKKMDIDFLACGCYKWLLGPTGAGYLYIKSDLIGEFTPPFVGWASVKYQEDPLTFNIHEIHWRENASKFEIGSMSHLSYAGAQAAIELILEVGIENIEKRILQLTKHLIDRLMEAGYEVQSPLEDEYRSGIVNFKVENGYEVQKKLAESKIITSFRGGGIRVSPHFYNTRNEIDMLLEKVNEISKIKK